MQHCNIQPQNKSSTWIAKEILKRTDPSNGDICMFHYPIDNFPSLDVQNMSKAFEMILEGRLADDEEGLLLMNASIEIRNRITRIQFSWYQFKEFPSDLFGRAYTNLQHLDIRQNASLRCIDSLISQLPHLTSLNLSDCPNICTLAPLAISQVYNLRHLWVRGCNLSSMSREEWASVFDTLAESPLERLTLSRNNMRYLHENIGKINSLQYLFVEDNTSGFGNGRSSNNSNISTLLAESDMVSLPSYHLTDSVAFEVPDELGNLSSLRFLSLCGNNITQLPKTMGRLNENCDVYLHRNPNLTYPPMINRNSIKAMRQFFHKERMNLFIGAVLFVPHCKRARYRANERLYRPGGSGYVECKDRFEETVRRTSITL